MPTDNGKNKTLKIILTVITAVLILLFTAYGILIALYDIVIGLLIIFSAVDIFTVILLSVIFLIDKK